MKKIFKIIAIFLLVIVLILVGYIAYMQINYYRIDDNVSVETENQVADVMSTGTPYSAVTYNIGFGAYSQDFSFFMDSGVMKDGTEVYGTGSTAKDEQEVIKNTNGSIEVAAALDADFYLFQEVDTDATRSHGINQYEYLKNLGDDYSLTFASNFHSSFLMYPILDPHGSVDAGLTTMSRYNISESVRRQFPVNTDFFVKFTDLDRCFLLSRMPVDGDKELVLINSHMSAYDADGKVRAAQLELLNEVIKEEYDKGNYVIVGGDFNHALSGSIDAFESEQVIPAWVFELDDADLSEGFSFVVAENADEVSTCRSSDIPYTKNGNYTTNVDGFLVSDNITATAENIDTDYMFSDHQPVKVTFTLN